jgi:hypothetical protein
MDDKDLCQVRNERPQRIPHRWSPAAVHAPAVSEEENEACGGHGTQDALRQDDVNTIAHDRVRCPQATTRS